MMKLVTPFLALFAFSLTSCGEIREENAEYFQKRTGLNICENAEVKNVETSVYDHETDFVYSVNVAMSKDCVGKFYDEILQKIGVNCKFDSDCHFMDENGWDYRIKAVSTESFNFTLRAI